MYYYLLKTVLSCLFIYPLVSSSNTFVSNFEAFASTGLGLCLGDCLYFEKGQYKCVINYEGNTVACSPTTTYTKRFRTAKNQICYSNCGAFNDESYQWCVVKSKGERSWDYCLRYVALIAKEVVRTDNQYMTCGYTTCGLHTFSYNWCGTIGTYWEYCDPSNKVLLINYKTSSYTDCATPCEKNSDGVAYCYDVNYEWTKCFLNPQFHRQLNDIHSAARQKYELGGTYTSSQGYKPCGAEYSKPKVGNVTVNHTTHSKFFAPLRIGYKTFDVKYHTSVQSVARFYSDNNPTVTLRETDFYSFNPADFTNPIVSYTVMPIPNHTMKRQLNIPLVINAIITLYTLRSNSPRGYDMKIYDYIQDLHCEFDNDNYDEPSFILAYNLGGPLETYNMFPQPKQFIIGDRNKWAALESDLRSYLALDENRFAEFTAVLYYETVNGALVHRPTGMAVRVRLYSNKILTDIHGNNIGFQQNTMENMFFTNDPHSTC